MAYLFCRERKLVMSKKQLALAIDLNVCVGCNACVTSCKQWNTSGSAGFMSDKNPYDEDPSGTFFNRVQSFEVGNFPDTEMVHFPKSCLHCENPPCSRTLPRGISGFRHSLSNWPRDDSPLSATSAGREISKPSSPV
mgnify:CR=1 FL=1